MTDVIATKTPVGTFEDWVENRHNYAREWKKRTGGKVVGYFCTWVPEEIMYAGGILPIRIFGQGGTAGMAQADGHIFDMYCPYCRSCLAAGLQGIYEYLDGIVLAQSCLHMRQAFWSWQMHVPVDFSYYIFMPHGVQSLGRYEYTEGEFAEFKKAIEQWTGRNITDEKLDEAIEIYNAYRRLMREVYDYRKKADPPIIGGECLTLAQASQVVDKKECVGALKELLRALPARKLHRETGARLMLIGSETDDRSFYRLVEEGLTLPATIVIDDDCVGSRYFWNDVIPQEDRLMAIAHRYLDRPPCPSKDWPERHRIDHCLSLVKDYGVQGAIMVEQKFCDPHALDMPALCKCFKDNGIPSYSVELDITLPTGQFSTRIEAFLEVVGGIE